MKNQTTAGLRGLGLVLVRPVRMISRTSILYNLRIIG